MPAREPYPDIRKIAVLRANALGDFIFVLPALRALRATYPQAEIVYLGKAWHKEFIVGHVPEIDRVIPVPPYPGVGTAEGTETDTVEVDTFFKDMRRERFDMAFQMHGGGGNSNPFLLRLGARHTIGTKTPEAVGLEVNIPYVIYQNEVLRLLEVVSYAGAYTEDIIPTIKVLENDRREAAAVCKKHSAGKYIVIHPGASDPRRHWPAGNFAQVAMEFIGKGYTVFVTGSGESERDVVKAVAGQTDGQAVNLHDALSFVGLTGLLAGADLVISNDTGPLHLAGAVGTKSVGIYWIGNLITAGHMTRMINRPLVSWTIACPLCGTSCVASGYPFDASSCDHMVSFVGDVTVGNVLLAAEELLSS